MNKYEKAVKQARIKFPNQKHILLDPLFFMMVDELGNELTDSKEKNELDLKILLILLELCNEK